MANEERWGVTWLQVVLDGSGDYTMSKAVKLRSLKFQPSGAGDALVLLEVTPGVAEASWPKLKLSSASGDPVGCLFMSAHPTQLMIDYSACTFSAVANAVITLEFD